MMDINKVLNFLDYTEIEVIAFFLFLILIFFIAYRITREKVIKFSEIYDDEDENNKKESYIRKIIGNRFSLFFQSFLFSLSNTTLISILKFLIKFCINIVISNQKQNNNINIIIIFGGAILITILVAVMITEVNILISNSKKDIISTNKITFN